MGKIIGVYKIPAVKHAFLIVSSIPLDLDTLEELSENTNRMEYFDHILRLKDQVGRKNIPRWTLKVLTPDEFLEVLERHKPLESRSTNQSSHNPESLELLAVNLLKDLDDDRPNACETPKVLCCVPDEDIIEVFI